MTVLKHFIAGARCPHCHVEDRLQWCREGEKNWLECVACGYAADEPEPPEYPDAPPDEQVIQIQPPRKPKN